MDVTTKVEDTRIADLLCCAFEGGVGYWCVITGYRAPAEPRSIWGEGTVYKHVDYPLTGGAVVCQVNDEDDPADLVLDREAVDRGLRLMAEKYPKHWADFISENEDAITGDVFVQCALLGEIVYG